MAKKLEGVETKIDEQTERITELETALATEKEQIAAALGTLNTTVAAQTQEIADLRTQLAELDIPQEDIDRILSKLEANNTKLIADKDAIAAIIPDQEIPTEPTPEIPEA